MLQKKYSDSRDVSEVTFELPKSELPEDIAVENVHLVGEFNDWNPTATPMKLAKKENIYRASLELEEAKEYQFRYLINGEHWCNDWNADDYAPNGFGQDNGVVLTQAKAT
jgi:hypothetical protein